MTLIPLAASRLFTGKERPRARFLVKMGDSYGQAITKVVRFPYNLAALVAVFGIAIGIKYQAVLAGVFLLTAWIPLYREHGLRRTGISVVATSLGGLAGIALALVFYVLRPGTADRIATGLGALYRLVYNKYFLELPCQT